MQKPDRSSYTAQDFHSWREVGSLALTPRFQRKSVWKLPARAYFIDTLLRGLPVPPIYLRLAQDASRTRIVREVVDGQQRLNALLGYIDGEFALSPNLDPRWAGKSFSQLTPEERDQITQYSFSCEVMQGVSDAEVLEIFARLNTYSVRLNQQELRNGRFFGPFKQAAYSLAFEHVEFWRRNRIFTEDAIGRMLEVELTSELMILQIDGFQDKKKSIDSYYRKYDAEFVDRDRVEKRFRATLDAIAESLDETLGRSAFRRVPLFYTLFAVTFHRNYGLPKVEAESPRRRLTGNERTDLRRAVVFLTDVLDRARDGDETPADFRHFVTASQLQTDNIGPRRERFSALYREAFKG